MYPSDQLVCFLGKRVKPGTRRVFDSLLSAETLEIYEDFVVQGNLGWSCLEERESVDKSSLHPLKLLYTLLFLQASNTENPNPSDPITTKAS